MVWGCSTEVEAEAEAGICQPGRLLVLKSLLFKRHQDVCRLFFRFFAAHRACRSRQKCIGLRNSNIHVTIRARFSIMHDRAKLDKESIKKKLVHSGHNYSVQCIKQTTKWVSYLGMKKKQYPWYASHHPIHSKPWR